METVCVSSKGKIVIPKRLRAAFQIEPGSTLAIFAEGNEIHLRQAEQEGCRQRENWLSLFTRTSWPIGKSTRMFKLWRWFTCHDCGRINCLSLKNLARAE